MEKVLRQLPESVCKAKACGDVETLRRLGRLGAAKKAQLKQERDQTTQKVMSGVARNTQSYFSDEEVHDAYAHAIRTRPGWDDTLS